MRNENEYFLQLTSIIKQNEQALNVFKQLNSSKLDFQPWPKRPSQILKETLSEDFFKSVLENSLINNSDILLDYYLYFFPWAKATEITDDAKLQSLAISYTESFIRHIKSLNVSQISLGSFLQSKINPSQIESTKLMPEGNLLLNYKKEGQRFSKLVNVDTLKQVPSIKAPDEVSEFRSVQSANISSNLEIKEESKTSTEIKLQVEREVELTSQVNANPVDYSKEYYDLLDEEAQLNATRKRLESARSNKQSRQSSFNGTKVIAYAAGGTFGFATIFVNLIL
jgi:hypothetical protein